MNEMLGLYFFTRCSVGVTPSCYCCIQVYLMCADAAIYLYLRCFNVVFAVYHMCADAAIYLRYTCDVLCFIYLFTHVLASITYKSVHLVYS